MNNNQPANVYAPPAAKLESNEKPCQECGATINKKAEICPKCGVRQKGMVSKTALLLLTFFLGGFGAHKFYLRKPVQGVFYVLFCWTYIPGLIALIEFIVYACTSEERLNEKYDAVGSGGTVAVIAIVGVVAFIFIVGILAAIAIPAYQDYSTRARVEQAYADAQTLRATVEQQIVKRGALPEEMPGVEPVQTRSAESGKNIATTRVESRGVVVIRFEHAAIAGKTIELVPQIDGNRLTWQCGGTLEAKYAPRACRNRS